MADLKIKPHIREILASSRIDGCNLYLPGTLDRETYVEVNKAITLIGGKWVGGKTKAHVFPSDPRSKFGAALESDVIVDVKKKLQAFFTPQDLARHPLAMARLLKPALNSAQRWWIASILIRRIGAFSNQRDSTQSAVTS
jgi:hypothetical protein